ncbi:hypothetical protein AAHH59_10415, partial [Pediococcus acidilactici]|uniref:hypothetical protein n=1 Tax=Pediococcus acidilactici TaxID=1254 RepID=UPI00319D2733
YMATATLNGQKQQTIPDVEVAVEEEKPKKPSNPLMKKLNPAMIKDPTPIDLLNGRVIDSDEVCYQKCASYVFQPLGFKSEKECIDFAKKVWAWIGLAEERRQDQLVEKLLSRASEEPAILEKLRARLEAA